MKIHTDLLPKFEQSEAKLVEYQAIHRGFKKLDTPIMSNELTCSVCGGSAYTVFRMEPKKGSPFCWFCNNRNCKAVIDKIDLPRASIEVTPQRAILWHLFCEKNGIGDMHHDVSFERLEQDEGKVSYLAKFGVNPSGIIFMQGGAGAGKTYSAMATCELFTRNNISCVFSTEAHLCEKWLESFKFDDVSRYLSQIKNCRLLVIDDFGTGECSDKYMKFLMELINFRMQWKEKGTIISTNLDNKKFIEYCGEALGDRIKTGQKFLFKESSRRNKKVL